MEEIIGPWNPVWLKVNKDSAAVDENNSFDLSEAEFEVSPNPATTKTVIEFRVGSSGLKNLQLQIYDLSGRVVKSFNLSGLGSSSHITWDRKDDGGKKVSNGIYFICGKIGDKPLPQVKKIILILKKECFIYY